MTTSKHALRQIDCQLTERHFRGTPDEVAAEIDEFIGALVAYRQSLALGAVTPTPVPTGRTSFWRRLLAVFGLMLGVTAASPSLVGGPDAPAESARYAPAEHGALGGVPQVPQE